MDITGEVTVDVRIVSTVVRGDVIVDEKIFCFVSSVGLLACVVTSQESVGGTITAAMEGGVGSEKLS